MSDREGATERRRRAPAEHWNSPEVALLLALLGVSLAILPFRGLPWYYAALLVCGITMVEVVAVTRLSPTLKSVTNRLASLPLLPLCALIVICAGIAIGWQLASSDAGAGVPPRGSVVNAQSGLVLQPQQPFQPADVEPGSGIEEGDIFRACNVPAEPDCPYREGSSIYARRSDLIRFKLRLHEAHGSSINFVKVSAGASETESGLEMYAWLEWPTVRGADDTFEFAGDGAKIRIPAEGAHTLEYIPGSSTLSDAVGGRLARLPDGIMGSYILLKNVGSPRGCWNCDLDYIRFVEFSARIRRGS